MAHPFEAISAATNSDGDGSFDARSAALRALKLVIDFEPYRLDDSDYEIPIQHFDPRIDRELDGLNQSLRADGAPRDLSLDDFPEAGDLSRTVDHYVKAIETALS